MALGSKGIWRVTLPGEAGEKEAEVFLPQVEQALPLTILRIGTINVEVTLGGFIAERIRIAACIPKSDDEDVDWG